jgi:hypothetical protein
MVEERGKREKERRKGCGVVLRAKGDIASSTHYKAFFNNLPIGLFEVLGLKLV